MERLATPFWVLELHSTDGTKLDLCLLDTEHRVEGIVEEVFDTREDIERIVIRGTKRQLKRRDIKRNGESTDYFFCSYFAGEEESLSRQLFDQMIICGYDQQDQLVF